MSSSPVLGDVSGVGVYDIVLWGDQKGELIVLDGQSGDVFGLVNLCAIDASPIFNRCLMNIKCTRCFAHNYGMELFHCIIRHR
jgi:hypothetical protein